MSISNHRFGIGDTAWCVTRAGREKVTVLWIEGDLVKCKAEIGTFWKLLSELYQTEQECVAAIKNKSAKLKDQYRKEINSVEDLVLFMFNHDVSNCEYQDHEARDIAIEKAKELLRMPEDQLINV